MSLVRFAPGGGGTPGLALVEGDRAVECSDPFADGTGAPPRPAGSEHELAALRPLAPSEPTKIVCASSTYRAVIVSLGKAWPSEPELAVVISRRAQDVPPEAIDAHILGYTCANDVSACDVLQRVTHVTRPKAHATFCPVGPVAVKRDGFDPDDAGIRSFVNGVPVLDTRASDMVFPVREILGFCSRVMTLLPDDTTSTGACDVGQLAAGDPCEIEIDGIGRLGNAVACA